MSSNVFPSLPGLTWGIKREETYKTLTDESLSRRMAAVALQTYVVRQWTLPFSLLRDFLSPSEVRSLVGLFNAVQGRFDSFLYLDPVYNTVTNEPFSTGDGTTTSFQIIATFQNSGGPGGPDIIQNFVSLPQIYDNGTAVFPILGPTGIVTFATPPASGHALTWTGQFYYRCHFLNDTLELNNFMYQMWESKGVSFRQRLL